jgi:hypothetical protein
MQVSGRIVRKRNLSFQKKSRYEYNGRIPFKIKLELICFTQLILTHRNIDFLFSKKGISFIQKHRVGYVKEIFSYNVPFLLQKSMFLCVKIFFTDYTQR